MKKRKFIKLNRIEKALICLAGHIEQCISSEDVVLEMQKEGYEPANILELLEWKDWNDKDCKKEVKVSLTK